MSTGKQLLEELRRDEELRRALAEELLPEALRHRELRRAMLIAISREMATKDDVESLKSDMEALRKEIEGLRREMATKEDLEKLRREMKEDVERLRAYVDARIDSLNKRIDDLGQRMSDLYGIVKTSLLAIVVTLASTILTPLILKLLLKL
jgi:hypothetical protein